MGRAHLVAGPLVAALMSGATHAPVTEIPLPTRPAAVTAAAQSVAEVATPRELGSGFAVAPHTLLTAGHVVAQVTACVVLLDGRRLSGTVVRRDPAADLALVHTTAALPVLALAASEPASGAALYALSRPGSLVVSAGSFSGLLALDGRVYVRTDAALSPGDSGGPIVTASGQVVGLVLAKLTDATGSGLAAPLPALEAFERSAGATSGGAAPLSGATASAGRALARAGLLGSLALAGSGGALGLALRRRRPARPLPAG